MKTILIILASLFSFLSFAQNPPILWQKNIGGSGTDDLRKVEIPNSTDYLLIGTSDSNISGDKTENSRGGNDIWILRLDQNHNILWDKTIGGDGDERIHNALIKNDTLFILSSSSSSVSGEKTITPFNTDGSFDIWLIAFDLSGVLLWQEQYGGIAEDGGGSRLGNIIELPNGNLLFGVNSKSGITGNKTEANIGWEDFWVVEISSDNGSIINQNTIGSSLGDFIKQLFLSPNNTIIISGSARQGVSGDKTDNGFGGSDLWLVELDMNLTVISDKCFGGNEFESLSGGTIKYINGYYYLTSTSKSSISGNKTSPNLGVNDYWLIKIDTDFNIIWDKTYGGWSDDFGRVTYSLANNRILLTGYSSSVPSGNKTTPNYGMQDAWVLIIDTLGAIIIQETYGGYNSDYLFCSPMITNGVFYLSGGSQSGISGNKTVPTNGGWDAWLMEIDASGFLNTESIEGVKTTVSVYPNPSEGVINVKFNDLKEDVVITFYSADGRILKKEKISTNSILKEFNLAGEGQLILYSIIGEKINHSGRIALK